MRYLPCVDLWSIPIQAAVRSGQLRLQAGQWVQCGPGPKSRFVSLRQSGSIWAVHAGRGGRIGKDHFRSCCRLWT